MSRSALVLSLGIHLGAAAVVGWSSLPTANRDGLRQSGIGVSFSLDIGGSLIAETPPAAPSVEIAPPSAEPAYVPPAPAIDVLPTPQVSAEATPPPVTVDAVRPVEIPAVLPAKNVHTTPRGTASSNAATSTSSGGNLASASRSGGGGTGYTPPRFLMRYKPPYPGEARAAKLEGTVLLLVSVDATGRVTSASVQKTCGHGVLDRAALDAVRSWRFVPAQQMDRAVPATVEVPIRFTFSA